MGSFARTVAVAFAATTMTRAASEARAQEPRTVHARGVAVVATEGSTDAAWPLARDVYASSILRPSIDERRARVLAGESVAGDDVRPLAELRAGIKGEDAASKQLLAAIADEVGAQGLLLVQVDGTGKATARQWVSASKSFDAAIYVASHEDGKVTWPGVASSLEKQWGPPPPQLVENAKPITSDKPASSKPFYLSPWFWGAIGAAVVGAVAVILATQDLSSDSIKLKLRVQ
jgi:hypothetical protein